jgi:hypothetical protein
MINVNAGFGFKVNFGIASCNFRNKPIGDTLFQGK